MATTFDELVLDPFYSADAEGGPDFATAIIRAGQGGSTAYRNSNREDYVSRYQIDFLELTAERQKALRKFAILREGMARGFRFLAPDDSSLETERVAVYDPATGIFSRMTETDAETTNFYLIKYYEDFYNSYLRRIVKPAPEYDIEIKIVTAADEDPGFPVLILPAGVDENGALPFQKTGQIVTLGTTYQVNLQMYTGALSITPPIVEGYVILVSCRYHLPVAFTEDWQRFKIDHAGISEFRVGIEELLPVELGL